MLPTSNLLRYMSAAPPTRPSLLLRLRDVDDAESWSEFVRLYTPLVFSHCRRHGLGAGRDARGRRRAAGISI